jgi:hypothetical protein
MNFRLFVVKIFCEEDTYLKYPTCDEKIKLSQCCSYSSRHTDIPSQIVSLKPSILAFQENKSSP